MNTHSSAPIVILGAGPAGCALAAYLRLRNLEVLVFDDDKRPSLLVGESLIPAVILHLRRLGLEEKVAAISQYKPGVHFDHDTAQTIKFQFPQVNNDLPTYAYNIPRPQFDDLLKERAIELGATFIHHRAKLEKADPHTEGREIKLSEETLAKAPQLQGKQPALIVDATGRARTVARLLGIKAREGPRRDIAQFAHFENFKRPDPEGFVIISRLTRGWSWRIPLRDCVSFGIVIDKEAAKELGDTPEERLMNALKREPLLQDVGQDAHIVSEVATYNNYQLISDRGHGPGWVAIGDAYGFVDPMLSPGLFMALEAASSLDKTLFAQGTDLLSQPLAMEEAIGKHTQEIEDWLKKWWDLIEWFYDGRIFSFYMAGQNISKKMPYWPIRMLEQHTHKTIAGMASGALTRSMYRHSLINFMWKYMVWDVPDPKTLAIR